MRGSFLDWSKARTKRVALAAGIAAALVAPALAPGAASARPHVQAQHVQQAKHVQREHLARRYGHKVG